MGSGLNLFDYWLKESIQLDRPWNQIATDLLTSGAKTSYSVPGSRNPRAISPKRGWNCWIRNVGASWMNSWRQKHTKPPPLNLENILSLLSPAECSPRMKKKISSASAPNAP